MRTTLPLDPEVSGKLNAEVARGDRAFKTVVNDALRRGSGGTERPVKRTAYVVKPLSPAFRPGIDTDKLSEADDELDNAAAAVRRQWEGCLDGNGPVGFAWVTVLGLCG